MVGVAQLVEHRVVAPVVVGSSPITHPIFNFFVAALALNHYSAAICFLFDL